MGALLSLIGVNKLVGEIIGGIAILGLIMTTYLVWKHDIQHQALLEASNLQLQQVIRDQKDYQDKQALLFTEQQNNIKSLDERNALVIQNYNSIKSYLQSTQAKKDNNTKVPDVVLNTIKALQANRTVKPHE